MAKKNRIQTLKELKEELMDAGYYVYELTSLNQQREERMVNRYDKHCTTFGIIKKGSGDTKPKTLSLAMNLDNYIGQLTAIHWALTGTIV